MIVPAKVEYLDLIGVPFELGGRTLSGLDCLGACEQIARRAFGDIPELAAAFVTGYGSVSRALEKMITGQGAWLKIGDRVGAASQIADLVHTSPAFGVHHASVLVYPRSPKIFLTTSRLRGVHAVQLSQMNDVVGVWRLRT